jgi:prepilin-type processing-associated H-X9-DG protein
VLVSNDVPIYPGSPVTLSLALTTFLGVNGTDMSKLDGTFYWRSKVRFSQITDGSSNTIIVGERPPSTDLSFGWWFAGTGQSWDIHGTSYPESTGSGDVVLGVREFNVGYYSQPPDNCPKGQANPYEFKPGNMHDPCDTFHFWSLHSGGANFLLGDGSVRFLPYTAAQILPALATRDKGETLMLP